MSKVQNLVNEILKQGKNTSGREWRDLMILINSKPEEAKNFATYIKTKLKMLNTEIQETVLDLLDYTMVEGKMPLHTQIASKDFLQILINLLKTRDTQEVSNKIRYLIKKWGLRFESQKDIIPNFSQFYLILKNGGVAFPDSISSSYHEYLGLDNRESNFPIDSEENIESFEPNPIPKQIKNNSSSRKYDMNPSSYPEKFRNFVKELSLISENIKLANEMINNTNPKAGVDDSLVTIVSTLEEKGRNLTKAIENSISDDKILILSLAINDDLSLTFNRYSDLQIKRKPRPFQSVLDEGNNQVQDNFDNNFEDQIKDIPRKEQKKELIDIFDGFGQSNNNFNQQSQNNIKPSNNQDIFEGFGQSNNNFNQPSQNNIKPSNNQDIFDVFSQPSNPQQQKPSNQGFEFFMQDQNKPIQNVNNNQQQKPKIDDLFAIYSQDYGLKTNDQNSNNMVFDLTQNQSQNQQNLPQSNSFPNQGGIPNMNNPNYGNAINQNKQPGYPNMGNPMIGGQYPNQFNPMNQGGYPNMVNPMSGQYPNQFNPTGMYPNQMNLQSGGFPNSNNSVGMNQPFNLNNQNPNTGNNRYPPGQNNYPFL